MYLRCLVEQDHFDVALDIVADWAAACSVGEVVEAVVGLAQELVNSSPALQHPSLEKARRVLKCLPKAAGEQVQAIQAETDFISACELLNTLVRFRPKHASRLLGELRGGVSAIAGLSAPVTAAVGARASDPEVTMRDSSAAGAGGAANSSAGASSAVGAEGFPISSPVQLRLQLHQPLRVLTDLLEFNLPAMLETDDLHRFLALLGIGPASSCWAEVMAMCAAAQLLVGSKEEARRITEQLLTVRHPAAWKLAVALASSGDGQLLDVCHGSDLLADAIKVCPADELPQLLSYFNRGDPDSLDVTGDVAKQSQLHLRAPRGYVCDEFQESSFALWMRQRLGFVSDEVPAEDTSPAVGGSVDRWAMPLVPDDTDGESSCKRTKANLSTWGASLLSIDRDTGVAMLGSTGALPSEGLPKRVSQKPGPMKVRSILDAKEDASSGLIPLAPLARWAGAATGPAQPAAPGDAFRRFAAGGSVSADVPPAQAPGDALKRLAGGSGMSSAAAAAPAPGDAFKRLAAGGGAPMPEADTATKSPGDAFKRLAGGGGFEASAPAAEAPGDAFRKLAEGGAPQAPGDAFKRLAEGRAQQAPGDAFKRLAEGGAPEAPGDAFKRLAEGGAAQAPGDAFRQLAEGGAAQDTSKSSWSFPFGFQKVTGALGSLMAAGAAAAEQLDAEDGYDVNDAKHDDMGPASAAQRSEINVDYRSSANDLRGVATRLLREHPPSEDTDSPVSGAHHECTSTLSALHSMQNVCPGMDLSREHKPLKDEVLKWVDAESAPDLIHAVTGVDVLHKHGVHPSSIALHVTRQHVLEADEDDTTDHVAGVVHCLSAADAADLLQAVVDGGNLPQDKRLEILGHIREASLAASNADLPGAEDLDEVVRQADALLLMRSVYQSAFGGGTDFPALRIMPGTTPDVLGRRWLEILRSNARSEPFAATAVDLLQDRGFPCS
eukprot:TRINITY_DN27095_c0_g1_i1.p1 TRINITY_DN27095_c0_g1~~TRINITY_DN27095_c0_g1_i1.p1  ORF type:complete len:948 (+),score=193.52 TRINITY_DN27095_c0_g1_i1:110-2953(+)